MGEDEENLSSSGHFTKGEEQPKGCRDVWAGLLFYAQAIAIGVFCFWLGVPALTKTIDNSDQPGSSTSGYNVDMEGLMYVVMATAGCAFFVSTMSLFVMSCCPKILIELALLLSLVVSLGVCIYSFMYNSILGGVFGAIIFALSLCYTCAVWRRIPFAAANLNTGLTALKKNFFIFIMAFIFVGVTFAYTFMWMTATLGIFDANGVVDTETGDVTADPSVSEQVFQNTMHAITAGTVSTWWFVPNEASCCCSRAIMSSSVRATTGSFGSICFGSLLVAIIQTLRALFESMRANDDVDGCAAFLLCLVSCILRCIEGLLEYFNKYAYIYVGMYGYSYLEAGKNVMRLFKNKGWTVIVNDDLISNVLALFNLVIGCLTGFFGLLLYETQPQWFESFSDQTAAQMAAFGFPFLIGIVVSAVMFSVVESSVNTVIVCFAEGPAEFEQNHPELSEDMRDGWRKVYPNECGF
eukprot:scaffold65591_cov47-Cyclotella_meneghiniana.AAC.1